MNSSFEGDRSKTAEEADATVTHARVYALAEEVRVLKAEIAKHNELLEKLAEIFEDVSKQVGPTIDALTTNPMLKMFFKGGK